MPLRNVLLLLPVLAVVSFAQDTDFPAGPQYLVTTGSSMTLRSIATPSLSLGEAQPFAANVSATETLTEGIPSTAAAPSDTFLGDVYWGEHKDNQIVGRRLETPSMTPSETAAYMNQVASQGAPAPEEIAPVPTALVVIELSGAALPSNLPTSIFDTGVTGMTNAHPLTEGGYGVPLGDVAAYWKSHQRTAPRVFTNADLGPRR